jgi:hypothetical protein
MLSIVVTYKGQGVLGLSLRPDGGMLYSITTQVDIPRIHIRQSFILLCTPSTFPLLFSSFLFYSIPFRPSPPLIHLNPL